MREHRSGAPEGRITRVEDCLAGWFGAVTLRVTERSDLAVMWATHEAFPGLALVVEANKGRSISVVDETPVWTVAGATEVARELDRDLLAAG